ncbi:thiolase family protein [uncultured Anaerococcus sp.]|uniref:thiolase family protein n=1 Tax=uncultured Anaerococcus sp. TaxID=293428 RepID=UPI00260415DC|nr:thiolase family protein [uncultured Anaerococcus sp.]
MQNQLTDAVIVAYGRSAIGRSGKKGVFRDVHPVDFGAGVLKGVLEKVPELDPSDIDDIILGNAFPEGAQGENMGRLIGLRSGLPHSVPGLTVNRWCSSGLNAISLAANNIRVGEADVIVAGGLEHMSAIPFFSTVRDRNEWLKENEPGAYMPMGVTAENVAEKYNVSREDQDQFSVESHKKAAAAIEAGKFKDEIIPLEGSDQEGNKITVYDDQGVRPNSNMESLSKLDPVFKKDGVVTAGNASQTSDGCAFVVLMSKEKAEELNIKPIAKFVGFSVAGVDPEIMGIGPIEAIPKVLEKTGLSIDDMDTIELNEAFASQSLAVIRELNLPTEKLNPNGGAIALGHPLGGTGAILTCKAIGELKRNNGKYGLITMCIGLGMGAAGVIELL